MANSPEQKSIEAPVFSPLEVDAFEQVAAHIKPSWELEDPPFSAGRRSAPHDHDGESASPVSGARAAGPPSFVTDVITTDTVAAAAPRAGGPANAPANGGSSQGTRPSRPPPGGDPLLDVRPATRRSMGEPPLARPAQAASASFDAAPARPRPPKVSSPSFTDESVAAMRPSRKGLWIGVAIAAIAGVAVAFAFMQTSSAPKPPATSAPEGTASHADLGATNPPAAAQTAASAAPTPTFVAPVVPAASAAPSGAGASVTGAAATGTAATAKPAATTRTGPATRTPLAPPPHAPARPPPNRPPPKQGGIVRDVPF